MKLSGKKAALILRGKNMNIKNEQTLFLREAEKKDQALIRAFIELVDSEFYPPLSKRPGGIEERIEKSLAKPEANFIIAEARQNPEKGSELERTAGLLSYERAWEGEKNAYISFVAVNPNFRNRKIASRLIKALEEKMHPEGMEQIYVCTWSTNQPARTLYEKQGFLTERIIKEDRGPGVDTLYLAKKLI